MQKRYLITAICIYMAYFTHGIQAIVITQCREQFIIQWGTDLAGIMGIVAYTGIGKLVSIWLCGELSDRIGRRPMFIIGAVGYIIFFFGLITTKSYIIAAMLAFLGGAATSCFDSASYPALQEIFTKNSSSALVMLKGAISFAGIFYPLMVGMAGGSPSWVSLLWLPLAISGIILLLTLCTQFPHNTGLKTKTLEENINRVHFVSKPSFAVEGVCCLLYGFISYATFFLIQQCITFYGKDVIGMSEMASRALLSYNSAGSISAVILFAIAMARGLRPIATLCIFTTGSTLSIVMLAFIHIPTVTTITSFSIGFFAAGGALQTGVALLGEYFPGKKGRNIGIYYTFMGLAAFVAPKLSALFLKWNTTGLMSGSPLYARAESIGKLHIIYLDLGISFIGFVMISLLVMRYKKIFGFSPFSLK